MSGFEEAIPVTEETATPGESKFARWLRVPKRWFDRNSRREL